MSTHTWMRQCLPPSPHTKQTWSSSSSSSRGSSGGGSGDATSDVGDQVLDGHSLQSFGKEACRQNVLSLHSSSLPVITSISITTHHHYPSSIYSASLHIITLLIINHHFTHHHYPSSIYSASLHILTLLRITAHHQFTQHHYTSSLYSASLPIINLLSITTHPHFTQNHCTSSLYSESLYITLLSTITHHHFTLHHCTSSLHSASLYTSLYLVRRKTKRLQKYTSLVAPETCTKTSKSSPKSMSLSLSGKAKHPDQITLDCQVTYLGQSRLDKTSLSGEVSGCARTPQH